jgi:beta-lactam-binding protein with PASTA domain
MTGCPVQPKKVMATVAALSACVSLAACSGADEMGGVEVPDLVGLAYGDAQIRLADVGLRWQLSEDGPVYQRPRPAGVFHTADDDVVHDQDPDAGDEVEPRSVIRLEISCRPIGEELREGEACID